MIRSSACPLRQGDLFPAPSEKHRAHATPLPGTSSLQVKIRREVQVFDGKLEAVSPNMTIVPRLFPFAQDRIVYQLQLETDGDLAVGQQQENWPT